MKFFICGFTGAGKTTILNHLRLIDGLGEYQLIDLDKFILGQQKQYESVAQIIEEKGIDYFRVREYEEIKRLSSHKKIILSLGGGALNEKTSTLLVGWKGVWLNTSFAECYLRIKGDDSRPITKKPKKELENIYEQRVLWYKKFPAVSNQGQLIDFIFKNIE
ncbi:MAG: shikimate kinase [Bacteriovoracaceae bacterium]|jgi:shikimate kinase|nr:shikimate kinase [Bacteriovoracaceae bacterium]